MHHHHDSEEMVLMFPAAGLRGQGMKGTIPREKCLLVTPFGHLLE